MSPGNYRRMVVKLDSRLGGFPKYILAPEDEEFMLVPDDIKSCCCFIWAEINGEHKLHGTAFFIGEKVAEDTAENLRFIYIVTAKHLIDPLIANRIPLGIRINTVDGKAEDIEIKPDFWLHHPTDESIDAVILSDGLKINKLIWAYLPTEMIMSDEVIKKEGIGIGYEVNMVGLFHYHPGLRKNLPLLRTGNIAMMPDEPILTECGLARSIPYRIAVDWRAFRFPCICSQGSC